MGLCLCMVLGSTLYWTWLVFLPGCSESEEETAKEVEDEEREKILRETDLEDSWLVPDGVEILSESDNSSSPDEPVKTRFNRSDTEELNDSLVMTAKTFNFVSDSESDKSPERPVKPGVNRNVVQLDSESDKTPEKPVKTRTKKIHVKSDSEESPEKPLKTQTKKKVFLIDSDSDKTPEKPINTKTNKKTGPKKTVLIDSDSEKTPEKPVKPRRTKKVNPVSDETPDKRVKQKFIDKKPKPEISKPPTEVRTFVPKTFLQSLNEDVSCPM